MVVGRRSVWAGGAEIPIEGKLSRINHNRAPWQAGGRATEGWPRRGETSGSERVKGHREGLLANDRVHGMESPWKSDGSASHPYPGVSLGAAASRAEWNQEALEAMRVGVSCGVCFGLSIFFQVLDPNTPLNHPKPESLENAEMKGLTDLDAG